MSEHKTNEPKERRSHLRMIAFEQIMSQFKRVPRRRRLREGARFVGPGLGARLQLWPFDDAVTYIFAPRTPVREGPKRCGGADIQ